MNRTSMLKGVVSLGGAAGAIALLAGWAVGSSGAAQAPPADACAGLKGMQIPASAISLPTKGAVVDSAVRTDKDHAGATAAFCAVLGHIAPVDPAAPDIRFQVNLPDQWNQRAVQYGGGGYNGRIPDVTTWNAHGLRSGPTPVVQGFVTAGDDSGHQAPNAEQLNSAVAPGATVTPVAPAVPLIVSKTPLGSEEFGLA